MQQFYMVEFELPNLLPAAFLERIPAQRSKIDELMVKGKIRSYSLSENRSKLWVIVVAKSEFEVMELLETLPLSDFMTPTITALMFHHGIEVQMTMSLN